MGMVYYVSSVPAFGLYLTSSSPIIYQSEVHIVHSFISKTLFFKRAFQVVLVVRNLLTDAGDARDVVRSLGGEWHSLQYSCLENSMDRGAWRAAD